jgi:hypothetical protein
MAKKAGKTKLKKIRTQLIELMKHRYFFVNARITKKFDRILAGTYGYVRESEYIKGRKYHLFEHPMVEIPGYQIGIYVPDGSVKRFRDVRISDVIDKINQKIDELGGE